MAGLADIVSVGQNIAKSLGAIASKIGGGTVTQVATGTGLTGGPISVSGTVALASVGITPGTYTTITSITVNAEGQVTAIVASTHP